MSDLTTRDQQAVRPWPVEVVTVPPHPRRPAGPYCEACGQHTGHWAGCQNTETEGDPVTYNLPDAEGEALDPDDDPVECTCYTSDPDDIGECRTCRRLVIGADDTDGTYRHRLCVDRWEDS